MNYFLANVDWDFSLANYGDVWNFLVQLGILLIFLLIGNLLRNVVPVFRKALIPSALIGGTLLLIVNYICRGFDIALIDNRLMQVLAYHGLGIGFAALSLKTEKGNVKTHKTQVLENGAMQGGCYMLQAFVGLGITILLFTLTKGGSNVISYISGLILPLAYGQGPGNALTWDINFTNISATQFTGNGSFGLSLASIGFIVASVIGVIYINIFKKKGLIKVREVDNTVNFVNENNPNGNDIPDNESVDKFSIQLGFVALAYGIAFGIMCLLAVISDFTNSIAWGFNFLWAVIGATLIKFIVKKIRRKKIMKRDYINNYQMDRISGFSFDLMIVAGVASIQINDIKNYILPIVILAAVGGIITFVYIRLVAKHCFKGFEHEFFLMTFGTMTGTASNGMILLKEIDPNLKTPTSSLYILSTFPATILIAPLLFLLKFAANSFTNACIACGIFFVLWFAYTIYLFRRKIFKKKYQNKEEIIWQED